MALAVVRTLESPRRLTTRQDAEDYEQELVDQYALALAGAGLTDPYIAAERAGIFAFIRFIGRPVWTTTYADADSFLGSLRRDEGQAASTVQGRAFTLARFFEFLISRYQGDVHALTGHVLVQPIDEFNRPARAGSGMIRVPPSDAEVDALFGAWREALPSARKYLPAARDYLAASLWRRTGLRIQETVMLDFRDWRMDLGTHGKLHVRFGKGSSGRGPKARLVPGINEVDGLLTWWLSDVRHQFGGDYDDPDAPLLPSERRDPHSGQCGRVGDDALRSGLSGAVATWLPAWSGRLSPHVLRHYCASSMYARGVDLKAVQELLGHQWLSTTTQYVHVRAEHIENAWMSANERVATRLLPEQTGQVERVEQVEGKER